MDVAKLSLAMTSQENGFDIHFKNYDSKNQQYEFEVDGFVFKVTHGNFSTQEDFLEPISKKIAKITFTSWTQFLKVFSDEYILLVDEKSPVYNNEPIFEEENDNFDIKFHDRIKFPTSLAQNELIVFTILSFLPAKEALHAERVCKAWQKITSDCDVDLYGAMAKRLYPKETLILEGQYESWKSMIRDSNAKNGTCCYFKISFSGVVFEQPLVFELYRDTPITSKNFFELCRGFVTKDGRKLGYKGSPFHRIILGFMAQGGDVTKKNGTGGESIYGSKFADENWIHKNKKWSLSMANAGPNTNGSQFFINFVDCTWLDGKHCVYGRVIHGDLLMKKLESVGSSGNGKPTETVLIHDCGAGYGGVIVHRQSN